MRYSGLHGASLRAGGRGCFGNAARDLTKPDWTVSYEVCHAEFSTNNVWRRHMHRTRDTYPLSHFRQRTGEHLERIRDGRVETITQNGQAAMVVMSPERYDFLVHSAERGHLWRDAIRAYRAGERGIPADEAIHSLAAEFGVEQGKEAPSV